MKSVLQRFLPWPPGAILISLLALMLLLGSWFERPATIMDMANLGYALLAIFLCAAIICSGIYPIHVRHNVKVVITTVPLYVAVMLLPPGLTALVVGVSLFMIDLLIRSQTGNTFSDIATATGRWMIIAWLCAWVGQRILPDYLPFPLILLCVACMMFICDALTAATIEIAPMSAEPAWRVFVLLIREGSLAEAVQYSLGIVAVLAALMQPWSLVLWIVPLCVVYQSFKYVKEMHDGTSKLLESMADAVDLRDSYTGGHSRRVTEFSIQIMQALGMIGPEVELIRSAARVHDIGKIGIPDQILNKAGKLTAEEKSVMDTHPQRGAELLARYKDFARGMAIVRHHHEQWDGKGYPDGLRGLDIPLGARIIAVADSYDAMTSDRPYRAGMPHSKAARILREGRGQQWDAAIVDAFIQALGDREDDLAEETRTNEDIASSVRVSA